MVKNNDIQFFVENMKMKIKKGQNNLTFPNKDLNPGFLNKFPPKILILREIRLIEPEVLIISQLYHHTQFYIRLLL